MAPSPLRRPYLKHVAVHRAGGADHVDIWSGSGAVPLQTLPITMEAGEGEGIWAKERLVIGAAREEEGWDQFASKRQRLPQPPGIVKIEWLYYEAT